MKGGSSGAQGREAAVQGVAAVDQERGEISRPRVTLRYPKFHCCPFQDADGIIPIVVKYARSLHPLQLATLCFEANLA